MTVFLYYFNLALPLAGFIFIGRAARGLVDLAKVRPSRLGDNVLALVLTCIGVTYTYLVVGHGAVRSFSSFAHLPHLVVLLTLVIPYIYMWYVGLLATYELLLYRKKAPGIVYRKSWGALAFGVGATILLQILLENVSTLTTFLNNLSIAGLVFALYLLIILLAIGYIFIARGARRLQKIEEV